MRSRPALIVASLWTLAGSSPLHAQRYNFKFYGEEEGLQNLAVQVVHQDRAGFLWVGTQNGLFRYDGNRFVGFGRGEGLPGSRIESLHESVDGTLWVGTPTGVARRVGDKFVTIGSALARGVTGREAMASDRDGRVYLATPNGLVIGSPAADNIAFRLVAPPPRASDPWVSSVFVDGSGSVWYGCGFSLCLLNQGEANDIGTEQGLPRERWDAILGDLDGNLWVRSEQSLQIRLSGARRFQPRPGLARSTNTYPTLALDPLGRLLVPTDNGLARQSAQGWDMVDSADGLTTNDISAVMQDREGSVWLGLLGSGLARWLGYNEWQSWSEREGLTRESVWSITRDKRGRLWVGTQFGLNYAENIDNHLVWRSVPVPGVNMVRTLAPAPDGSLWIGGDPGGLIQLSAASGGTRRFSLGSDSDSNRVRDVHVDRQGRVWVATRRGLFRSFSSSPIAFQQMFPAGGKPNEGFLSIAEDGKGQIWICGDLGLVSWSKETWRRYTKNDGLKADMVSQVALDADGSAWIGYRDAFGITHLTPSAGSQPKVDHVTVSNGLRSEKSLFLGFDNRGWLWVGTDRGVDVFHGKGWRHYGRSDGLIWDDTNSNAFMADADGSIWIGTSKGLSRFMQQAAPQSAVPPPVVFTSVKFGDQFLDPGNDLTIPYPDGTLQVRFAALTFVQNSNVVFRYRMAGVESRWLETAQRELNYPQLGPGLYTLEVAAKNGQGVWSAEPARLRFQITTPWFLTWWFRAAIVIVALILSRRIWLRRARRMEAERQRLETAVTQRTRELSQEKQRVLEEKSRAEQENLVVQRQKGEIERLLTEARQASKFKSEFLANMSHEIRTPMNGILGMTDMVLATPLTPEQREYLETARFSADSLLNILNDILDFSKIEAGHLDLNPIEFSLHECLTQTGKLFLVPLSAKRLQFDIEISENVPDRMIGDPDRLRQVLLNLIGNAVKFTHEGGIKVIVRGPLPGGRGSMNRARKQADQANGHVALEEQKVCLEFAVRDTGIGIPVDKQQLIFEAFRQADGSTTRKYGGTGLGLAICSRLVELMGGSIRVESHPGSGSEFIFTSMFGIAPETLDAMPSNLTMLALEVELPPPVRNLHVLLAEDNVVNQRLASRLLEKRGHHVALASTGGEALARLKQEMFDVILMDVQMPDMDGLETTAIIREREKDSGIRTPIVALTAHTMKGDRERCLAAGMDGYVTKPINAAEFLATVESVADIAIQAANRA